MISSAPSGAAHSPILPAGPPDRRRSHSAASLASAIRPVAFQEASKRLQEAAKPENRPKSGGKDTPPPRWRPFGSHVGFVTHQNAIQM
eukprot:10289382-Karenia_brevis.AAC.1